MSLVCGNCGARLKSGGVPPGGVAKCPRCKSPLNVPAAEEPAPPGGRFWLVLGLAGGGVLALLAAAVLTAVLLAPGDRADAPGLDDFGPRSSGAGPQAAGPQTTAPPAAGTGTTSPPSSPRLQLGGPDPGPPAAKGPDDSGRLGGMFQAAFMNAEARGERFCIIADKSSSMNSGVTRREAGSNTSVRVTALDFLKTELTRTLTELDPEAKFNVILFSTGAEPMPGQDWHTGAADTPDALAWVGKIRAAGGTNPVPAFERAFRLRPRPDVIFFMTDGQFRPDAWEHIARLNSDDPKVSIHTIQLQLAKGTPAPGSRAPAKGSGNSLGTLLRTLYRGNAIPDEIRAAVEQLHQEQPDRTDWQQLYQEAQMRLIADQAGGSFRVVTVAPEAAAP